VSKNWGISKPSYFDVYRPGYVKATISFPNFDMNYKLHSSRPFKWYVIHGHNLKFYLQVWKNLRKKMWLNFSLDKVKHETMHPAVCMLIVRDLQGGPFVIVLHFVFYLS